MRPQPFSSRRGRPVRLLAIHTAEGARTVENLDAWFRRERTGSSHAGADNTRLVEGGSWVPYDHAAWTLRSGNPISDNLELCGFASWTRTEWLGINMPMLRHAAQWLADRSKARGIPLVKLTPDEVRAGKSGVIGHHDWTLGMRDGTHWDPGPGFPWDVVMQLARDHDNTSTETDSALETADMILIITPTNIPAGAVAYPIGLTNNGRLFGISDQASWLKSDYVDRVVVDYKDWVAVVQAHNNPLNVELHT